MKVLEYGDKGLKCRFRCTNCGSLIEMYDSEADWFDIEGRLYGVYCPVCKEYNEHEVDE